MKDKYLHSKHVDEKPIVHNWSVWRQDDNGNVAIVQSGLTKTEALRLAAEYEARGHKQTYWAQENK